MGFRGGTGPSWPFFLTLFILLNTGLSYSPLSGEAKFWVGVSCLLGLFVWALSVWGAVPSDQGELAGPSFLPSWVLPLVLLAAFGMRVHKLDSFFTWPSTDEGWQAYYPLELFEKWDWRLLFGSHRINSLYFWLQTLLFQMAGPSLWTLYLLPALFSLANVGLAYLAARQFFDRGLAVSCAVMMALSFWPLLVGRIAAPGSMVPSLELLTLYLWGKVRSGGGPRLLDHRVAALGVVFALGFYTMAIYWAGYWFFFHGWIAATRYGRVLGRRGWILLVLVQLSLLLPLAAAYSDLGIGPYVRGLWVLGGENDWAPGTYHPVSYVTSLLWWADPSGFMYGPCQGGLLNPVSGALFLVGLLWIVLRGDSRWRWALWALPFFWLPGLLSKTYEMYRIIPLLPLSVLLSALGLRILAGSRGGLRPVLLWLVLASAILDGRHLFGPFRETWAVPGVQWRPFKSLERWRAYRSLKEQAGKEGPGIVLSDFVVRNFDRTLDLGTYPFNSARNRALSSRPGWVGVLFPSHLLPFLQRRFPDGQWSDLSAGLPPSEEGKCLGIIPAGSWAGQGPGNWVAADRLLRGVARRMLDSDHGMTFGELQKVLWSMRPAMEGDPFLLSCLDQKILGTFDNGSDPDKTLFLAEDAIHRGYPSPFFLQKRREAREKIRSRRVNGKI